MDIDAPAVRRRSRSRSPVVNDLIVFAEKARETGQWPKAVPARAARSCAPQLGMSAKDGNKVEFPFPFEPYSVQQRLMTEIYRVLEAAEDAHGGEGKDDAGADSADTRASGPAFVGVFESPTGTGKSLSILCSTLHWLHDRYPERVRARRDAGKGGGGGGSGGASWVDDFFRKKEADDAERAIKDKEECLAKMRERARVYNKQRVVAGAQLSADGKRAGRKRRPPITTRAPTGEDAYLVDYAKADGVAEADSSAPVRVSIGLASDEPELSGDEADSKALDEIIERPKVIYCSRTHSQLRQFARELKKTAFAEKTRCVSLGSRKNLCINETVTRLGSIDRINDRCLDLRQSKKKTKKKLKDASGAGKPSASDGSGPCPYLDPDTQAAYRDQAMARVHDIEELHTLGDGMGACPYYGVRKTLPLCHLVTLPYQSLLHADTRASLGIDLADSVVVVDEAHNLIETINDVHSLSLSLAQMRQARSQLTQYLDRYKDRLRFSNTRFLKQAMFVLERLIRYVEQRSGAGRRGGDEKRRGGGTQTIITVNDFLFATETDNINLFPLCDFIQNSGIVKKLNGFLDLEAAKQVALHARRGQAAGAPSDGGDAKQQPYRQLSVLGRVRAMLVALTNADQDGRIIVNFASGSDDGSAKVGAHPDTATPPGFRFVMLNPAVHFASVLAEAKAVLLLGGTMQPFAHFTRQLFPAVPADRVRFFECGHVVPPTNVLALALATGPSGRELKFTYSRRGSSDLIDELGRALGNLFKVVPQGVVVFFPSFAYKHAVEQRWAQTGQSTRMGKTKRVIWESRGATPHELLAEYKAAIDAPTNKQSGAALMCVVGGKLSEGINFSDGLARCVAVVGMPYPNSQDVELKEKIKWIDAKFADAAPQSDKAFGAHASPGSQYYENLCMRAVNQSIGRSIRHKGDFAAIVLIDSRYQQTRIAGQIPAWIRERLSNPPSFGAAFKSTCRFFASKRKEIASSK